jgi:acyl-homoserine lactone synthase
MIKILKGHETQSLRSELDQAFRLRHNVFVENMGWDDLRREDGREIDQFDDEHAVHMLYVQEGRVLGYQRMLSTLRPHLLSHVLPHLCEVERPRGPNIWEWTRYCVDPAHRERGRHLSPIASALLTGIVEWGLGTGVDTILIQMNPLWLLRLVQLHFRVQPLGFPQTMGRDEVIAVAATFDQRTLSRLHETSGRFGSVLSDSNEARYQLAS